MTINARIGLFAIAWLFLCAGGAHAQEVNGVEAGDSVALTPDSVPGLYDRARALLDSLRTSSDSISALERRILSDEGMDLEFSRALALKSAQLQTRLVVELSTLLSVAPPDSLPVDSLTQEISAYVSEHVALIDRSYERQEDRFESLRRERASATVEDLGPLEAQIADVRAWSDTLIAARVSTLEAAERAGVDVAGEWERLDAFLVDKAEHRVGRLEVAVAERTRLNERVETARRTEAPESEIADLQRRLSAAQTRVDAIAASLRAANGLLAKRGYETDAYREALIRSTGEVTGDVLDPRVLVRLVRGLADRIWSWLRDVTPTAIARILIVVGFVVLFRLLFRVGWWLARTLRLLKGSRLMVETLGRALRPVATFLGFFAGLSTIGVNTTALLAGLGAAGVVLGLALQDSVASLFAGLSILRTRPYDIDDVVEVGGVVGMVRGMNLWNTIIVTFDNRRLLVPNRNIWNRTIENRSAEPIRRAEAVARIGYDQDQERVIDMLMDVLESDDRVIDEPAPSVFVSQLADSWAEVTLWPWVRASDWWPMTVDLPRLVHKRLAEEGIEIPYPRVEILQGKPAATGDRADSCIP
ncbi:MAG: mechanosensitive ion channel domain-containing protein [Gemmatimonadota bacterium]